MRHTTALALTLFIAACTCSVYIPAVNVTIPSGYIPNDYKTITNRTASGQLVLLGKGDPDGNIVLIPAETQTDSMVAMAYAAGAVATISYTTLATPGSSYAFHTLHSGFDTVGSITLDIGALAFQNLTAFLGMNATVNTYDGNSWIMVFSPANIRIFWGVVIPFCAIGLLSSIALLVFATSFVERKRHAITSTVALTIIFAFFLIGRIDYGGRMVLYGHLAATFLTNFGIQLSSYLLWNYLFMLSTAMEKRLDYDKVIRKRQEIALWILSFSTPVVDVILGIVGGYVGQTLGLSLVRLAFAAANLGSATIWGSVIGEKLRRYLARRQKKTGKTGQTTIHRAFANCAAYIVTNAMRFCYAVISVIMYGSPYLTWIHMWIETWLGLLFLFVVLVFNLLSLKTAYSKKFASTSGTSKTKGTSVQSSGLASEKMQSLTSTNTNDNSSPEIEDPDSDSESSESVSH